MATERISNSEMNRIRKDEAYLFYEMMIQSLKTDDVKTGLNKSLYLLRMFLQSGNIALYRKNKEGRYVYKLSDTQMDDLLFGISCIINKTAPLTINGQIFTIDLNLSERLKNLMTINLNIDEEDLILAIINNNKKDDLQYSFYQGLKETMQIILKRAVSYERNTKAITTDLLTGLDNRNSYEMRMQEINLEDQRLVLAIFDLFRLKSINDDYSHAKGDDYIKAAADILAKYWPKQNCIINEDGTESFKDTGHCVYRYGGDEYVLLSTVEDASLTEIKAKLAVSEGDLIDIGVDKEHYPLGLNYGVAEHTPGEKIKHTFEQADALMRENKGIMYKKYKLERRR